MDDRFDRLETMIVGLREEIVGVREEMSEGLASLGERIAAGDEETRSQLKIEIDSLRDDIRIFAEAHLSLEKRVTLLERRPR